MYWLSLGWEKPFFTTWGFFRYTVQTKHIRTHIHINTPSPPPTINNHDAGSLLSWWIWYWLYGLFLLLQGADMVGFLCLEGVPWGGWIDSCIDNSLLLSVGGCFMVGGGWDAESYRGENLAQKSGFYLSSERLADFRTLKSEYKLETNCSSRWLVFLFFFLQNMFYIGQCE